MEKQRIAVIGGGVGAITAIYSIMQVPDWNKKYDITVYQLGWRLGGKGASGRNLKAGGRIEEHGLHVWAGFYENAFRNMRACYDQLAELGLRSPDAPLGTFKKAFKPLSHLFLAEDVPPNATEPNPWRPWLVDLPSDDQVPGDGTHVPGPFEMFQRIIEILLEFLRKGELIRSTRDGAAEDGVQLMIAAHQALHEHAQDMPDDPLKHTGRDTNLLLDLIKAAQAHVAAMQTPENLQIDPLRRALFLMDVSLAYAHGIVGSDAFVSGYDALDEWEFTDWLRTNGAGEHALSSALLRGCYDFVFGFPMGDTNHGNAGAGTAVRAMSRLILTYRGAVFFKMQAGMGDTIFAPYYQVMTKLGVKFEYFAAARDLKLSDDGTAIARIDMVRQAKLKDGPYRPLVTVKDLPCWPSEPDWDQLVDGAKLRKKGVNFECEKEPPTGEAFTLEQGRDFDTVILGASLGSLPYMTGDLVKASPRWKRMLDRVKTVGTHAAQFWLTRTAEEMGWNERVAAHNSAQSIPPSPLRTVITAFDEPLDTWADMSHLLDTEDWPDPGPASIAYFCSPAPDGETLDQFRASVATWQEKSLPFFWPKDATGDAIDPNLYYPTGPDGGFDAQYFRVNMYGSERYVLSVKDSVFHRLAPGQSGFSNLVLAGDWTRCGLNAGCVEAATMSGIAAASAVTGVDLPNIGAEDIPQSGTVAAKAMFQTNGISGASWPISGFFARGEMSGWFLFYALPRDEVEKLLPQGVHLGRSDMVPAGMHPVGMSFCRYHNVRGSFIPNFLAISPYLEASFAIPNVLTRDGRRAPFLYPRRLYVNNRSAIWAGKVFYAMNKASATLQMDDRRFRASGATNLSIDAQFQQLDDPMALSGHPAHGTISDLLDMSFITRRNSGKLLYNAFNLELDRAYIAPTSGQVEVSDGDPDGFPDSSITVPPLMDHTPQALPGAFRIWCSWSMTNPLDSTRVRHATMARAWLRGTY